MKTQDWVYLGIIIVVAVGGFLLFKHLSPKDQSQTAGAASSGGSVGSSVAAGAAGAVVATQAPSLLSRALSYFGIGAETAAEVGTVAADVGETAAVALL